MDRIETAQTTRSPLSRLVEFLPQKHLIPRIMSEQHTTRNVGERRRRRNRGDRRSSGNRNPSVTHRPASTSSRASRQSKNPVVAFFKRLFGLENAPSKSEGHSQSPRRDCTERPRRERSRSERQERTERDSSNGNSSGPVDKLDLNEITTPKLYIGNLSYDASESDLFELFSTVGPVQNIEIARDKNMNSKGFGFAEMASVEAARALAEKFHRSQFMDRQLVVTGARKP